ncbi:hypothetical protein [Brevibacillus sp. Leaf182]|uniref:hypothetical protein n=1 Tax=Brevibacillus sp. Leaf182 TaxID=1736290 RepID=UPI000DCA3615|nr:hypothetical protein [Brevibacillus sp. Leaf182]RAT95922.1 hypothetical protein ASG16_020150 [Brevibacillus sp. Leaf182]
MNEDQVNALMAELSSDYKKSRHMRAIMSAASGYLPVDSDMWKAFFLHLMHKESLELWRRELDAADDEDLLAKLRATNGRMTVESILSQGYGLQESYRLMPEDGVELSEFGVMADGWEFAPLTAVIFTTPETLGVAQGIVKLMGPAGFRYLFSIALSHKIEYERGSASQSMDRYGAILTTDHGDDELSGKEKMTNHSRTQYSFQSIKHDRMSWWSPNVFFTDDVTFVDEVFYIQQSKVTKTN